MKRALLFVACLAGAAAVADDEADFEKHARRAAPRDAFPVLNHPRMVGVAEGDKAIDDDAMSREHAAVEWGSGCLRIRDLGSRNGTQVNGHDLKVTDLHNGDRIAVGEHVFQLVMEERKREPKTWVVDE